MRLRLDFIALLLKLVMRLNLLYMQGFLLMIARR